MKHRPSAHEITKITEVFDKLLGPRRLIVGLSEKVNIGTFSMTCKGDFPFPFQAFEQIFDLEVSSLNAGN